MRYIPVNCLQENMICGKRILGKNGSLLLNSGAAIKHHTIKKLKEIGISGIYIDDQYSRDIVVEDIISDTQRSNSVKAVKNMFYTVATNKADSAKRMKAIADMVDSILDSVISHKSLNINLMDLKTFDDYTYFHSVNVGVLSILIGHALKLSKSDLHALGIAAMLHDIGKVFIAIEILNKPGKLTPEEFDIVKTHCSHAFEYLDKKFQFDDLILDAVLDHHERYDGFGYPNKKSGNEISQFGSIIAIADVFDALTSDRPYRLALPAFEAIEYIMGSMNTAFEESVVKAFLNNVMPFSPGTLVRLSDGSDAVVLSNNQQNSLRPVVRIVRRDNADVEPRDVDLLSDLSTIGLTIIGVAPV